jgi:Mannosyltransferase (PIG-V)
VTTTPLDQPAESRASTPESGRSRAGELATTGGVAPSLPDAYREWWEHPVFHPVQWWESLGYRWLPGVSYPITVWVVWRIVHLIVSLHLHGDAIQTAYNYDGERYLQVLHYGYANAYVEMPNTAFFPGISWFAWPVYQLTKSNAWTVHTVASFTGVAALIAIWGVTKVWRDESVARKAVWLVVLMPSSMFLWAFYSEGLFIALGAGALWADRRGRHGIATACLFAIATTRSVGILVPLVLVLARVIRNRRVDPWCVAYACAGVAGVVPVLYMQHWYTGDWFAFVRVQKDWGRGLSWPWVTVGNGYENLWPTPETIMVPALVARNFDLWCVPVVFLAIGYVAIARKDRFPMESWMISAALIALPLCSTSLASFNRFVFADWIIFAAYASFLKRLPPWWRRACWTALIISLTIVSYQFIDRYSVERFVG